MKRLCLISLLLIGFVATLAAQNGFYLKDGDRVVFYGDSITDQRLYTLFTEAYVVTRFPKLNVSFVHSGWGGDRVTGGGGGPIDVRLKRDVFPYRPTVMTIMLGMNDGSYRAYDDKIFETYASGYRHIIESVKSAFPGERITVIEPSPFDDVTRAPNFEGGYNAVLVRYGQFLAELANKEALHVADLNTSVVGALHKAKEIDSKMAERIIQDRVHPGPGGQMLMAEALLKSWSAPAAVGSVTIDASGPKVITALKNISSPKLQEGGALAWSQTDDALPMPIDMKDPVMQLAMKSSDFIQALDQQTLQVTNMKPGRYALSIDGERVGAFSDAELAAGVNLAVLQTPMAAQAMNVLDLTRKHNDIHFARWRMVQVPLQDLSLTSTQPAMDALDRLEAEIVAAQRAAAVPKPHEYRLALEN